MGNGYSDVVNKWLGRQKKVLLMTREGNTVGNGYSDVVYDIVVVLMNYLVSWYWFSTT